jgi:hypothetical protein
LKNRLANESFSLVLIERGNDIVTLGIHFRIVLQIINKTTSKLYVLINLENLKLKVGFEKTSERELDIIDIIEKVNTIRFIY